MCLWGNCSNKSGRYSAIVESIQIATTDCNRNAYRQAAQMHGNSEYHHCNKHCHIAKLEAVQNRAARFVSNVPNCPNSQTSVSKLVSDLGWDTLKNRRTANRLTILQKSRHDLLALPVDHYLQLNPRQSRHNHPNSYKTIKTNKDCLKYSFFPRTTIDWNTLPYSTTLQANPVKYYLWVEMEMEFSWKSGKEKVRVVQAHDHPLCKTFWLYYYVIINLSFHSTSEHICLCFWFIIMHNYA